MIQGNQAWQQALSEQAKQPLYVFEVADFGIIIGTFSAASANIVLGGCGVALYGVGGYGT